MEYGICTTRGRKYEKNECLVVKIVVIMVLCTACTTIEPHSDAQALAFTPNITISADVSDPSLNDYSMLLSTLMKGSDYKFGHKKSCKD